MIGEAGSVSTLINAEKLYRESMTGGTGRQEEGNQDQNGPSLADSVTISPQAIAMSRNVPPTGESSENGSSPESERQPEASEYRQGSVDIRV